MPHSRAIAAIADRTRRTILQRLNRNPCAVTELARELGISQPATSQHLRALRSAGLVLVRHEGVRRLYRVDPTGLAPLRAFLATFGGDASESDAPAGAATAPDATGDSN